MNARFQVNVSSKNHTISGLLYAIGPAPIIAMCGMLYTVLGGSGFLSGFVFLFTFFLVRLIDSDSSGNDDLPAGSFLVILVFTCTCLFQLIAGVGNVSIQTRIGYLLKICIGFFVLLLIGGRLKNTPFGVVTVALFVVTFGLINLVLELRNGLSLDRSSALGYSSKNFTSATLYLSTPLLLCYGLEGDNKQYKKLCAYGIFLALAVSLISSSKTTYACVVLIAVLLVFRDNKSILTKSLYVIMLGVCLFFIIRLIRSTGGATQGIVARGFSYLGGYGTDSSRTILRDTARFQFLNGGIWARLFGTGELHFNIGYSYLPPHNLMYELLLSYGYVGLFAYASGFLSIAITSIVKTHPSKRIYPLMLLIITAMTAWYQPFFSTSYVCGAITTISFVTFAGLFPNSQLDAC